MVSRSKHNAENFAAKYGVPKVYDNFDAMIDDPGVDVVYLGVPRSAHKEGKMEGENTCPHRRYYHRGRAGPLDDQSGPGHVTPC
ncbi:MAG: Gfo/Idh/MocA family oxidoreductase [Treponema sp.]|nr:Gfo/Idh/MocA family oxidoreductase [Treponema sp.]